MVWFVERGTLSHASAEQASERSVELAVIGPRDVIGLGSGTLPADGPELVALSTVRLLGITAARLATLTRKFPTIRELVLRTMQIALAVKAQRAVCRARHRVEQRVSGLLLEMFELALADSLPVTHEELAARLGVRRASVTMALHVIEGELAVHAQRKRIAVRDQSRLQACACGCHLTLDALYRRAYEARESTGTAVGETRWARSAPVALPVGA